MKKTHLFFAIAFLAIIISCQKLKDLASANFDYTFTDLNFSIPVQSAVGTFTFTGNNIYINADSMIKAESDDKLNIDNIKTVYIKSCSLDILPTSAGQDFSSLESCTLQIVAGSSAPIDIASIPMNPDQPSTKLTLTVNSSQELSSLFKSNKTFGYNIVVKTRRATTVVTDCKATVTLNIKAGL